MGISGRRRGRSGDDRPAFFGPGAALRPAHDRYVTLAGNLPINGVVPRVATNRPRFDLTTPSRTLLACGVAAPLLALASTLVATAAHPGFNPARQYLSELGGASAGIPQIFNAGIFVAGVMAALAGGGFGLALITLTNARIVGGLTAAVFVLAGAGLAQAAIYPWPDPRHLAVNLALGIQLAPLLLLWGLWPRGGLTRLKLFLMLVFVAMGVLTVLTKHLIVPSLVNDANVGWWERAYALILVGWVGVAAFALERCLRREAALTKAA
jgi:glucan biosynthesis protein C